MNLGQYKQPIRIRHKFLRYSILLLVVLMLHCTLITFWELRKYEHKNVTEQEAYECVQVIRSNLPSTIHRLNSLKIVLAKNQVNSTRYTAITYGVYGGIWAEIDLEVQLSYVESIKQGNIFSCEGSISSKTFGMS